jgi:sodium-independent sulfate anion transporter 11
MFSIVSQGIAYAGLAGLPPQTGLFSAIMGSFLYTVFGSTMQLNIGATAIIAFMTRAHSFRPS